MNVDHRGATRTSQALKWCRQDRYDIVVSTSEAYPKGTVRISVKDRESGKHILGMKGGADNPLNLDVMRVMDVVRKRPDESFAAPELTGPLMRLHHEILPIIERIEAEVAATPDDLADFDVKD